ncbi:arginyltransferase [soil metagenome]
MISLATFVTPPHDCAYRPGEAAQMRYEIVESLSVDEYHQRLQAGWRRFGHSLFKPQCPQCTACQSLRVDLRAFQPDRSQKRAWKANVDVTRFVIEPQVTTESLNLYDRFHNAQHERIGWPDRGEKDPDDYLESFALNPVPTQEWQYRTADGQLLGVGYIDQLPDGLSAIYFFHDPDERDRSLGTFNVLNVIAAAAEQGLPYVYMGYYVAGCRSLEYKARFRPNQVLTAGAWQAYR